MAEALGVVGIVASIAQLVDFGTRVLKRLEQYRSDASELPEAFRHINAELPVMLEALSHTKTEIDDGRIQEASKKALLPAIEGCKQQIQTLEELIGKALPTPNDSWATRRSKALKSLQYDGKVGKITMVVRGYIQTLTYYAAASSKPTAGLSIITPSSTVPFRRDPQFVDRRIMQDIGHKSQQPASRVALVGLGGVGKSQLAIEYSYRIRAQAPGTWVFWVHAGSTARFAEGYKKIAERARITGCDQKDADTMGLVHSWLCDETNGHWLMIIDNADDHSIFSTQSVCNRSFTLLDALPQSSHGSILITSRNQDLAFRLTGDHGNIINVHPMDAGDALILLDSKLKFEYNEDDAVELVKVLDYMPLAISQAACYINQRSPRATVSKYLQSFLEGDEHRTKILGMDIGDCRRDSTASNSILATWQISFQYIYKERRSATQLLALMSCFDRQGIPDWLLEGNYHKCDDTGANFEDDLHILMSFSLVGTNVEGDQFEMHRLVQFSMRKWLELKGDLDEWRNCYYRLLDENYPHPKFENWKTCQVLFPHAQAAITSQPADITSLRIWASLLYKSGLYARGIGNYSIALEMLKCAVEASEIAFGEEYEEALYSKVAIAVTLEESGDLKKAEVIHRQVFKTQEKILGPKHLDTLRSCHNIGVVLYKQNKLKEAETITRHALEGKEGALSPEHKDLLSNYNDLGRILLASGKHKEAEAMIQKCLEGHKKVLGPEHPYILNCRSNIASLLYKQGRYQEAEREVQEILAGHTKVLGQDHPDTLTTMSFLASTFHRLGRLKEAQELWEYVLPTKKRVLGEEHYSTVEVMDHLASVLWDQSLHQEAISLMENRVQIQRRTGAQYSGADVLSILNIWRETAKKTDT